ncbi:MAG: DUF488 domain-containing protein [Bryobacteraceae bacterium]
MLTIGHSTHPIAEFVDMLHAHGVEMIVDVRTVPKSRHNPQFNRESLADSLAEAGIAYTHMAALGGLRHPRPDSPNTGWRNISFRGYADYMQSPEFAAALQKLMEVAREHRLAIMCAEAVPWRCHRSLIADAATVRGVAVEHIMSATARRRHSLTPFARVEDGKITYTEL